MSKPDATKAELNSILSDHFDQHWNPHDTIYKIWLVLNVTSQAAPIDSKIEPPLNINYH